MDHNITFDNRSTNYITKHRCDVVGRLNYEQLLKDMVIRVFTDFTGSVQCVWHVRQALNKGTSVAGSQKSTISVAKRSTISKLGSQKSLKSQASGQLNDEFTEDPEVQAALRKIIVPK